MPADALILDLEDSVAPANRVKARGLAQEFLKEKHTQAIWLRINPVGSADYELDLEAIASQRARRHRRAQVRTGRKCFGSLDADLSAT